jgi:hypothetical protein
MLRRMPAAVVVFADLFHHLPLESQEPVDQRRFAWARRSGQSDGSSFGEIIVESLLFGDFDWR